MANVGVLDTTPTSICNSDEVSISNHHDVEDNVAAVCSNTIEYSEDGQKSQHIQSPSENGHLEQDSSNDKVQRSTINGDHAECDKTDKSTELQALQDVGNRVGISALSIVPRKSLLKRPKSETSNSSISPNPPKRIRIVENLESLNGNNCMELNDGGESVEVLEILNASPTITTEISPCGETLRWLNSSPSSIDQSSISVQYVRDNLCPIKRNFSVEIDMRFILSETCTQILGCKSKIAGVGSSEFHLWVARQSAHNYPSLKFVEYKENFLKLANIDSVLNYALTAPKEFSHENSDSKGEDNVYYVGDIWQSSKGFREYLLSQTSQAEKLFSTKFFTMRTSGPCSTEEAVRKAGNTHEYYPIVCCFLESLNHVKEKIQHAYVLKMWKPSAHPQPQNILDAETINRFVEFVLAGTNGKGLHTIIVDNAEVSNVYESCREIRFQKYFYCETLLALRTLREGGTLIVKIFDTFTVFTNGVLLLLYKCFKNVAIHKPSSSSVYTSERFLICKGKLNNADTKYVIDFLSDCLDMVVNNQETRKIVRRKVRKRLTVVKMEVQKIVPLRVILSHAEFFEYVRESNIRLTTELINSIDELCRLIGENDRILLNINTSKLHHAHQSKLSFWKVPASSASISAYSEYQLQNMSVEKFFCEHKISTESCSVKESKLDASGNASHHYLIFPGHLSSSSSNSVFRTLRGWFYGNGGSRISNLQTNTWVELEYSEFVLPQRTLILGEISEEIKIVSGSRKFVRYFHIFDGAFVNGMYIGSSSFKIRQAILTRFVISLKTVTVNTTCVVVPSLNSDQLPFEFYQSTKSADAMGYDKSVRCYVRESSDSGNMNLALVDGFLLIKDVHDLSPSDFFKRSENLTMIWNKQEDLKSCLQKLQ